ncbi:hypothetical protein EKG37_20450 [Robertmurraya yapensis]|uniref:Endospore appendages core domain-containing protein n=2 Tax=Bacillus yapensis TaxID=2492960 RepID=A0A3S0KBJ8_9BACI|nr:hypothetical protein EKG37_20450 [Bacillus yapensis]TKS93927.1 hypothetical protein FAR12_20455 [Bacillus yapensis]
MIHRLIKSCWSLWPKELCVLNIIKKIDFDHHHHAHHKHHDHHDHHKHHVHHNHDHSQGDTIIKEEFCGNFMDGEEMVWQAPSNNYIQGTFQVFNSSSSIADVNVSINSTPTIIFPAVSPGFTISRVAINPTSFTINAPSGTNGTYCITLFKRIPLRPKESV